ncbi:ABC transporter family substrate-binding protein [Arcanobacterium hippocoleae]|uniref:Peptide/nickel transport system substrate-binding protein n=1 Tax=Arcanobacterium hippocoleae TaxID=149017 RepID=A0ABU1T0I0_9ACTO|nr:ABC transporter family substrate-binding protein [Arcanobacterium hippocoleae]MDR6938862.1 peptide/nickel transport system substrate-binding protein [Arcanobacterium hippocoleae]
MRKSAKAFVALSAAAMLALSACGGKNVTSSGSAEKSGKQVEVKGVDYTKAKYEDLKDGGTLTLPLVELSPQQNPFHQDGSGYTTDVWYLYNPQVALFDDKGEWYANPAYLTNVKAEEKDGNTVVTFDINEKAKWNDGTDIDWTVFRDTWTINSGKEPDKYPAGGTDGYDQIKSVEQGANADQAVVTFDGIYAWWQGLFNMWANPHLVDADVYANGYLKTLHPEWGAGPYKVKEVDFNQGVVSFEPNEKWWGDKAKLDTITYRQMETKAAINAFKNGEIDYVSAATKETYAAVKEMKDIKIYTAMIPNNSLLMLNSESEALKDVKVREAIMGGIDRAQISKIRFDGIPYTEELPGSFLLFGSQPGYEDNFAKSVKFDAEGAKKLLDEAGWKAGEDGIREKDGKKLSLVYPVIGDAEVSKSIAKALQQMMKQIGVDFQIKERPSNEFSQVYTKKEFDAFMMSFRSSDPFGVAYFDQIYASDSGLNLSGTGTPEFDQKIAELKKVADPKEQIAAANKLEVEAFKLHGIMPVFNGPDVRAAKDGLANLGAMGFAKKPWEHIGWVK